jgi:hypothetical protein
MTRTENHETPRPGYGDFWYFYICNELDCGFFYKNATRRAAPVAQIEVFVVALGKRVKLDPAGTGEAGHQCLLDQGMADSIFPVDLFHRPYQIDVKVSRTVPPELHERWLRLIAYCKNEPFVSERREYVRVLEENGQIVQQKLCTAEEFEKVLEREAEWRTKKPDQWQPGTWRLATDDEKRLS